MRIALLVMASALNACSSTSAEDLCAAFGLVPDYERDACRCPDETDETADGTGCALPDGGVLRFPDAGARDAGTDGGFAPDASPQDAAADTTRAPDGPLARCDDGETRPCEGGSDVGECSPGIETCVDGTWGPCAERIGPTVELCDGRDNDCDDVVDGPVASASCGIPLRGSSASCSVGNCVVTGCLDRFLDCDEDFENGCESELGTEASCGGCGDVCAWDCAETSCDDALSIAAASFHSCLLRESGTVVCWGANDYSQLGIGDGGGGRLFPSEPVTMIENAVQIASGERHSCARLATGTMRCWGWGSSGQLGNGGFTSSASPVTVDLASVTSISLGQTHTCAIDTSGRLYCWGRNTQGEVGDGTQTRRDTPQRIRSIGVVTSVGTGQLHTCAVSSGSVRCWGLNNQGQTGIGRVSEHELSPALVPGLNNVTEVRAGADHTCALRSDGSVWCWGGNEFGQLGDGTFFPRTSPVRVDITDVRELSVNSDATHTCAIRNDHTVWCWGRNIAGQAGDGTMENRNVPVPVTADMATVSVNWRHSCGVTRAGRPVCWGSNGSGRLGDGTTEPRTSPTPVLAP